jgi:hypothetical protein
MDDKVAFLEDAKVLHHGKSRQLGKMGRQFTRRGRPITQDVEHLSADRVGQGSPSRLQINRAR